MTSLADIYTSRLHDHFKTLYAVWTPGKPVAVGDVGVLKDDIFIAKGNLANLGIGFQESLDHKTDQLEFNSSDSTEVVTHLAGSGPAGGPVLANGGVEINFASKESVFFNAADCKHNVVADQLSLANDVMKLFEDKRWDDSLVVVTEVVEAGSTTVVASGGSDASVLLEATAQVPSIDLSDAKLKFNVRRQKNVGLKVVSEEGLTPLIGLSKVQSKGLFGWGGHAFEPESMQRLSLLRERDAVAEQERSVNEGFFFGRI